MTRKPDPTLCEPCSDQDHHFHDHATLSGCTLIQCACPPQLRVLTVQQPWAWAIVHGGKHVENRTQLWNYRGPLAIHAGLRLSARGVKSTLCRLAAAAYLERKGMRVDPRSPFLQIRDEGDWMGKIIGISTLVDTHTATDCRAKHGEALCSPWAEELYAQHDQTIRRDVVHLVLENVRPLKLPIEQRGQLGLWTPDRLVVDDIRNQLAVAS